MERGQVPTETSTLKSIRRKRRLLLCLQRICRITMFILLTLLFIIYFKPGTSFHEKQLTQPASLPRRFFPGHSQVADFYFGELQPVIKLLGDEELIFVMYYAPWDAKSMHVRGEFIRAAKILTSTMKFAAVNCWHPEGECSIRMKFHSFPQLFVYHTGVADGYRFSGIQEAEYFVKFAENFLFPLKPLTSERQIREFMGSNDNAVIGYFDFNSSPQPPGSNSSPQQPGTDSTPQPPGSNSSPHQPGSVFHQFYLTALRISSYDFYQPVRFGVVRTPALASLLDLATPNRFVLTRIGNTTLKYPLFYNMTSKNMSTWILHYKQKNLAPWLVSPGVKSLTLSIPLQKGPAVLVFAPNNPLTKLNPYHDMIQLAAYAFRSCGNNTDLYRDRMQTFLENAFTQLYYTKQFHKKCLDKKSSSLENTLSSQTKCCVSVLKNTRKVKHNSVCEYCVEKSFFDSNSVCDIDFGSETKSDWSPNLQNSCSDFTQFYNVNEYHSVCCRKGLSEMPNFHITTASGKLRRSTDPYVINGLSILFKQYLSKLTLQKIKHLLTLEEIPKLLTTFSHIRNGNLTGLQCGTNKSIEFYYLDSAYHSVLLHKLKVPYQSSVPTVILVDMLDESVFLLKEKLNFVNLARFVQNYTKGLLSPYRRSAEVATPAECSPKYRSVCITELTSSTFQEVVIHQNKDVFVMFYSHWCGFCAQVAEVFMSAARFFRKSKEILFARLNGDTNDLPWMFTVDVYPTMILFPANRKSDSVQFPDNVAKTLPNLLKFLLYHINQSIQIDTAVSSCSEQCIRTNKNLVLSNIAKLETNISQLERRARTLWGQTMLNQEHQQYIKVALETIKRAQDIRNFKLRKAQMLNHFLKHDLKRLDKGVFLELITRFSSL